MGITELFCKVLAVPSINTRANAQTGNSAKEESMKAVARM